jgi:hypothetical protein
MSLDASTVSRADAPLEAVGAAIEQAASLGMQLGMIGLSVNAAMADAWLHGAEAMVRAMARSSGLPEVNAAPADDAWVGWRHAYALAAEPWQAWLPLLRIDMP